MNSLGPDTTESDASWSDPVSLDSGSDGGAVKMEGCCDFGSTSRVSMAAVVHLGFKGLATRNVFLCASLVERQIARPSRQRGVLPCQAYDRA